MVVKQVTEAAINRGGCVGLPTDRWSTTSNYYPRFMEYLEWMHEHQEYGTSFKDLQVMTNMSQNKLNYHCWNFNELVYFTTQESVIAFLEHKSKTKPKRLLEEDAIEGAPLNNGWISVDLNQVAANIEKSSNETSCQERHHRSQKQGLRVAECRCVKNSLEELNRIQRSLLGLENFIIPLSDHSAYKSWLKAHMSKIKDQERFEILDKSHKSLAKLPTKTDIKNMLGYFLAQGREKKSLVSAYNGLMYRTMWLLACQQGLMRMDNCFKVLLSDLEYLDLSDFGDVATPVKVDMFLTKQDQSKTNKDGVVRYVCCCPNLDIWIDPMASMAAMMVLKHDLLCVAPPDFSHLLAVPMDVNNGAFRPWYFDFLFSAYNSRQIVKPFSYKGMEFKNVESSMKTPLSLSTVAENFEKAMISANIDHHHVLHLPRVWAVMRNGVNGIPAIDTKVAGGWLDKTTGSFESSYMLLPLLDTATKMAGASQVDRYRPFWACITPPSELTDCVLSNFSRHFEQSMNRVELSKGSQSKIAREWLHDKQAVFFGKFVKKMTILFVQFAPMLLYKEPNHILVRKHKVYSHPAFEKYTRSNLQLIEILQQLNTLLPPLFTNTPDLGFQWMKEMRLSHTSSSESTQSVMQMICSRLTTTFSYGGNIETEGTLSEILKCATSNNISYEIAEWKKYAQRIILEMKEQTTLQRERDLEYEDTCATEKQIRNPNSDDEANQKPFIMHLVFPTSTDRIQQCMNMWLNGWGEDVPPLKKLLSMDKKDLKRPLFGTRKDGNAVRIVVRRVRLICVFIELLSDHFTLAAIQDRVVTKKMFCSTLAKHIATIFSSMGINDGKCIMSEDISKDQRFCENGGINHLKMCACKLLGLED
eukprot:g8526.t1